MRGAVHSAAARHARPRLRAATGRGRAGARHRHLPHAHARGLRLRRLLCWPRRARLPHLPGQAHGGALLPRRLHRAPLPRGHAGIPRRGARGAGADGRRAVRQAALYFYLDEGLYGNTLKFCYMPPLSPSQTHTDSH
eukprot:scaffold35616_cov61-Phaeocystis_antarctica.AAC.2